MLRKILFLVLVLFAGKTAFCQDTIHLVNHQIIVSKVIEINPKQVKYKISSYPDGPLYVVNKTSVDKIVYADGMKSFFMMEEGLKLKIHIP